jgi:hypothetical protein
MVRVGGMGFTVHVDGVLGQRISNMHLRKSGAAIEANKDYVVSGWASISQDTQGPDLGCRGGTCAGPRGRADASSANRSVRARPQLKDRMPFSPITASRSDPDTAFGGRNGC